VPGQRGYLKSALLTKETNTEILASPE